MSLVQGMEVLKGKVSLCLMARGGGPLDPLLEGSAGSSQRGGGLPWTLWRPILQALAPHLLVCPAEPSRPGSILSWTVSGLERPTCSLMDQSLPGEVWGREAKGGRGARCGVQDRASQVAPPG